MKKNLIFGLAMLTAGSLLADPKDDVTSAAKALGDAPNYSWKSSVEGGQGGSTDGKTEKGGYTTLSQTFNDNTMETVIKGTNGAIKTQDNGWQSVAELTADTGGGGGFNRGAFMARRIATFKTPDAEVASLAGQAQSLATSGTGITGDLTEDAVKGLLTFRRGANADAPTVANPKGSVTFWLADGKLTKYSVHVSGTVSFNGNDRDVDRTTTTEIKDVGTTTVTVSDEAKKKIQ